MPGSLSPPFPNVPTASSLATRRGNLGGLTLQNWQFLAEPDVWKATLNSFGIAMSMVIGVGAISALAAYALSRMNFPGRKGFLGMTMVLHAFRPKCSSSPSSRFCCSSAASL